VQTLEPTTQEPRRRPPRSRDGLALVVALGILLPVSLLLIQTKWGVLVGVVLAMVAGIALYVVRKGFAFIEVAAFLIHFDGLGFGPVRMGRIVAAVAAVVILRKLLVEKWRPPAVPTRFWAPVLLLFTWAVASGIWSSSIGNWFYALGLLGLGLAFFATTGFLVDSHEKIQRYLRAYWMGGLWGSLAGVWALVIGTRSVGFGGDPNFFGLIEASMIPLTVYYRRQATTDRERLLYTLVVIFVFAGAAGAGSRSGVIGASLAIFGTMVTRPGLSRARRARVGAGAMALAAVSFVVLFIANPANLDRGFSDRGAGRLDFWNITVGLIPERPLTGFGGGQLGEEILPRLPITPGVQKLKDSREEVSSHNTWLDVTGDYGVVGLALLGSVFVITMISLARPRWPEHKQLSTTLLVMMLPVLSSSNFLPLLNNKLAWSLIGLAAALQVPSWGTRWSGYFDRRVRGAPPPEQIAPPARAAAGGAAGQAAALDTARGPAGPAQLESPGPAGSSGAPSQAEWVETKLARWDLRISRRFRAYLGVGALVGMVLAGAVTSTTSTTHTTAVQVVVPQLDGPAGLPWVDLDMNRVQVLHTLVFSNAYAAELRRLAGLDASVEEIRDGMWAVRPKFGPMIDITFTSTDRAMVDKAGPHLADALSAVVDRGRRETLPTLEDELRPTVPGEQRYYEGDLFLPVSETPSWQTSPPRTLWNALVGAAVGALVATGFVLLQQRRPRVNSDDDFPNAVGMPLLTHVGRVGRRYAASGEQYSHVAITAFEATGGEARPRRMVIAGPVADRAARGLAMGVAASLAASGERVVLVDGQVERPLLSARLGGWRRPGIADASRGRVPLESVIRRVARWRLPVSVRRTLGRSAENLRLIPAGSAREAGGRVDPDVLDRLDPDIITILLAPPLLGAVPAAPSLRWADVVLYCLVEGRTVTFDAEDGALRVRTFSPAPAGVVLSDV
jgi:hypothetical protein